MCVLEASIYKISSAQHLLRALQARGGKGLDGKAMKHMLNQVFMRWCSTLVEGVRSMCHQSRHSIPEKYRERYRKYREHYEVAYLDECVSRYNVSSKSALNS